MQHVNALALILTLASIVSGCVIPLKHDLPKPGASNDNAHPIPWSMACGLPSASQSVIRDAFRYWEEAAYNHPLFKELSCTPEGVSSDTVLVVSVIGYNSDGDLGLFHHRGKYGYIELTHQWTLASPATQNTTVRHEIGHLLLGHGHSPDKNCLSYFQIAEIMWFPKNLCYGEQMALRLRYPSLF